MMRWSHGAPGESAHRLAARIRSNPAQIVVSVVVAALLAAATWLAAQAGSAWLQSTRLETRSTALATEELRHLYQDEAPLAFDLALMFVRADALESVADDAAADGVTPASRSAAIEAATLRRAADELQSAVRAASPSLLWQDYERDDHGYAVSTRLADALTTAGVDPKGVTDAVAEGDRLAAWALRLASLSVIAAGAFVVVRMAGSRHRRTVAGSEDIGLVPQPWQEATRSQRTAAGVALTAWLLLPVLTAGQLVLSLGSARDDAESSRRATTLTGSLLASQLYNGFAIRSQQDQLQLGMLSLARQLVTIDDGTAGQAEIARADEAAASTWARVSAAMTAPPKESDGVPAGVVAMVTSEPSDHTVLLAAQHAAVDSAQRRGDAANLVTLALLLAGLTATAAAMARRTGRGGRAATTTAAAMVGTAVLIAVVAVARSVA